MKKMFVFSCLVPEKTKKKNNNSKKIFCFAFLPDLHQICFLLFIIIVIIIIIIIIIILNKDWSFTTARMVNLTLKEAAFANKPLLKIRCLLQ